MKYINFNNAGSSKAFNLVNKEINSFLEIEKNYGGYYAVLKYKKKINSFYNNLSQLINCKKKEISFLTSTTLAWNLFFNSLKIDQNQNVLIFENEYGSNLIYYKNKRHNIKIVNIKKNGKVCFEDLKNKINKNTKVVSLCHVASQCGNRIEAEKIFNYVKQLFPDVICILDACQSIGQIEVDVKKINCDVLVGSGRKYLRGPRGTGFIYINDKTREKINPMILDMKNAEIVGDNIKINKSNIFENFEFSPSLQLGFSKAIEKINNYGIYKIEQNIISKSKYFRKKLENFHQITFFENIDTLTGINTLKIKGINSLQIYKYLLSKRILCSVTKPSSGLLYFKKLKVKDLLRISFHQYNSYNDINYLVKCLIDLIKKKAII